MIDGRGLLAVPGLVNAHTHSPMVLMRGAAEDVTVEGWFNDRVWPMESNLTPADVRIGARLACAEMIRSGVTTFADHYFFPEQIAEAVAETGLRADIAPTYFSSQGEEALEATVGFAQAWHGRADGRVTVSLGPHAPYTVDDGDLRTLAGSRPAARPADAHPRRRAPGADASPAWSDAASHRSGCCTRPGCWTPARSSRTAAGSSSRTCRCWPSTPARPPWPAAPRCTSSTRCPR